MLVSSNVTMQFGSKPLFENISVKFGGGNRYGLIGANGSGKSTFMKLRDPLDDEYYLQGPGTTLVVELIEEDECNAH
ncbi:ATP-binding cassette domain-containing protein [Salmonella enterica]|nr:ATP-binding cassette domain-containing protein [Salmonella enterica]